MAVNINFEVFESANCKEIHFRELTGLYNALTNPTGWKTSGAGIDDKTLATSATLTITSPSGVVVVKNLFTSSYPTTDVTLLYTINSATLGLTANQKLEDGLWIFLYTVVISNGPTTYTQTVDEYLYCNTKCCVYSLFGKLAANDCSCQDKVIDSALKAFAFYQSLIYAAGTGQTDNFDDLQTILDDICNSEDCGCA